MADEKQLGEVADIIMGQSPPGSTYNEVGNGLPFFQGVKDFNYRHPTVRVFCSQPSRIAQPGDILLSVRAPIGRVNIAECECAIGRGLSIIRARSGNDQRYIEFVLRLKESSWDTIEGSGSVFGNATRSDLESLVISWPTLPAERQAVACILGALDDKIELNRRMNKTLEEMARAIFKSWFMDFLPVRAKQRARTQTGDPVRAKAAAKQPPGLKPDLAALFPDAFEDSELGQIPRGWQVIGLNETGTFLNGLALQKYPPAGGDSLPVIKIAQLRKGSTEGADRASADIDSAYIVEDGDILFSWSGSLECVIWTGGRGALNQHLFKVTSDRFARWFCYLWIQHHLPSFRYIASGKATTMGHIQRHHLTEAKGIVPPPPLLARADQLIQPLVEAFVSRALESRTVAGLRDTLLPKLLSGELRVKDAERFLRGVVP